MRLQQAWYPRCYSVKGEPGQCQAARHKPARHTSTGAHLVPARQPLTSSAYSSTQACNKHKAVSYDAVLWHFGRCLFSLWRNNQCFLNLCVGVCGLQ